MSLHPSAGVRILLERGGHPGAEPPAGPVRYRGAVFTPAARFDYEVVFSADGAPTVTPLPAGAAAPPAPPRAEELLAAIARTVGRHAASEEPPSWPRRVLRWRKSG